MNYHILFYFRQFWFDLQWMVARWERAPDNEVDHQNCPRLVSIDWGGWIQ